MKKLDTQQVQQALNNLPNWQQSGDKISRTIKFKRYLDGIAFVGQLAQQAEQVQHHPDLHILWRNVTIELSTHDVDGLSEKDFAMAHYIEENVVDFIE